MALLSRKKTNEVEQQPVDLNQRITTIRESIEDAKRELRTATAEHDQAAIDAVLTAESLNPAYRQWIETAANTIRELEDQLPVLFAAQRQQGAAARRVSAEVEEKRVADLKLAYRNKIADVVAANRQLVAELADADALWFQLPLAASGFGRVLQRVVMPGFQSFDQAYVPTPNVPAPRLQPVAVINFETALCCMNYGDLLRA